MYPVDSAILLLNNLDQEDTQQHEHIFLFIMLYKMVLTFESEDEIYCVTTEM